MSIGFGHAAVLGGFVGLALVMDDFVVVLGVTRVGGGVGLVARAAEEVFEGHFWGRFIDAFVSSKDV